MVKKASKRAIDGKLRPILVCFTSSHYEQKKPLAMDIPFSSILAEIFLNKTDRICINIIKKYDDGGIWINIGIMDYTYQKTVINRHEKSAIN